MKLLKGTYVNFGSYANLVVDYSPAGLALVSGPTGSGKSTLFDAPSWALFGETSKGQTADEVRSWNSEEITEGIQYVETSDGTQILVTRRRGNGKNDLFWNESSDTINPIRGKDLADTQKLLCARIGVDSELYFTSAYFTQFSTADSFFVAKAKARREMLETIADLSLPAQIDSAGALHCKIARGDAETAKAGVDRHADKVDVLNRTAETLRTRSDAWRKAQKDKIQKEEAKAQSFEADKNATIVQLKLKIRNLDDSTQYPDYLEQDLTAVSHELAQLPEAKCSACGAKQNSDLRLQLTERKRRVQARIVENRTKLKELDRLCIDVTNVENRGNYHQETLRELVATPNPYIDILADAELKNEEAALIIAKEVYAAYEARLSSLEQIRDLALKLRGVLLERSVREIQDETNGYLEKYFDGEIKVTLSLDADKLEVEIQKNGNACSFKVLSGGQRCLLKLCFAISLMHAAANKAGQKFSQVFLDEPLHALDEDLKVKAFSLLQDLSQKHESVFVIEHSEGVKALFDKRYEVTLVGDRSQLSES